MKQLRTRGIVLSRTDYGEADRIITVLTPDAGKLRLMARGVRKIKSKLAGGIELFSVSDITYMPGRGDIGTLISARLSVHYGRIVEQIERVQLGYELLKQLNKATEDETDEQYFAMLDQALAALNDPEVSLALISTWFRAQLLRLDGHAPNLQTDTSGQKLLPDQPYDFDFEAMTFTRHPQARFNAGHIKTLRLLFNGHTPQALRRVQGIADTVQDVAPLVNTMAVNYVRS
jgi:DNA repair protein RecO (recombination protein O)